MDRALSAGRRAPLATMALLPTLLVAGTAWGQSARPIEGFWVPNGPVRTIEADNAGRVYLGGTFDTVGPYTGTSVRLDPTTAALTMSSLSDGTVYGVAPDGAGGWYLGGDFTRVRGLARQRLAHVLADGRVSAWNPGANSTVAALAAADGAVYVGGYFTQIAGQSRSYFATLDAATGAVMGPSLSPGLSYPVWTLSVSGDTLYVGGYYNRLSGYNRTTGSRTWDHGAAYVRAIVRSGGVVYAAGDSGSITSGWVSAINATSAATIWTTPTNGAVRTLAVIGSRVYLGGPFTTVGTGLVSRDNLASLLASNGSLTSWDPNSAGNTGGVVYALAAQGTTLYVGGDFSAVGGATRYNLGAVDTTIDTNNALAWHPRANDRIYSLVLAGGHLFAGGQLSSAGGVDRNALAALDAATAAVVDSWDPDPHYTSGGAGSTVDALALGASGTLYVAGGFNAIGGLTSRSWLAAVDYDGNGIAAFDARSNGTVAALAASGTSLYVSGQFSSIGGGGRPRLAALNQDNGDLLTWNANASGQQVDTLTVESGLVYAGGAFTNIGGAAKLVGLDPATGARDTAFSPLVNSQVLSLKLQESTLYAGGVFTTVNSLTRNRLAGLAADSGAANDFNPNVTHSYATAYVYAIAPWGSTIFAGGIFNTVGGQSRTNLAAVDSSIGTPTSWNPGIGTEVRALKISHNTLYVGGDARYGAGEYRRGFLAFCLVAAPSALTATPAGPNRIDLSWAGSGASSYEVRRSRQAGGPYDLVATVAGNTFSDTTVEGGVTYYYVVHGNMVCSSDPSNEASATTTGSCALAPDFDGLAWARQAAGATCGIELGWPAATAGCGDALSYSVYRDTTPVTPGDSNRIAADLSSTRYTDTSALDPGVTYYYVVRARALASGLEDTNTISFGLTPASCTATLPGAPRVITVRAGDGQNTVEWLNPGAPLDRVRLCAKDGSVPADQNDGDCSDQFGVPFDRGSVTEPVANGTARYYAIWGDAGGGRYSARLASWGRPQSVSGADRFRWAYTTAATALAPVGVFPELGYFMAGNDEILHRMASTENGGTWPAGWSPALINAAGAWRPLTVLFPNTAIKGSQEVAFVAAQDGRVYAIDAASGIQLWASPQLGGTGGSILTSPSATFSDFGASFDLLLVAARTSAGNGILYGIRPGDGQIAWSFNNGGGANAIGLISGTPQVELTSSQRVYFTSRHGGSLDTVWCLSFTATTVNKEWSVDLGAGQSGESDAGPILRNGKLYVGTLTGDVRALWPADGSDAWTVPWTTGNGAVKAFVWVNGNQLFFSTLTQVHAIVDGGTGASPLWTGGAATSTGAITLGGPSAPFLRDGRLYVGNNDGRLYSLDATTDTPGTPSFVDLGDPAVAKVIGPPSHDVAESLLLAGSDQGVVYAVARPF
jgi:outer membrane protein assembly factor BamB